MFPFHVDLADSNTYFHRKTPFCKQIYKIFLQIAPAGIKNMEVCKAGRQQKEPGIQNGHTGRHPCGSAYGSAMKSNAGNRAQAAGGNRPKRTALRTTCPDNLSKQSAQTTYPNDRTQPGKRTYTDDRTRVVNRTIADRQNDRTETGTGGRRRPVRLNAPPTATP